jgi:hypothetical protein
MLSQLAPKGPAAREWERDTSMLQIELTADERIGLMAADSKTRTDVAHRILVRLSAERERGLDSGTPVRLRAALFAARYPI